MLQFIKKIIIYIIHFFKYILKLIFNLFKKDPKNKSNEKIKTIKTKENKIVYNSNSSNIDTNNNKENAFQEITSIPNTYSKIEIEPNIKIITFSDKLIGLYITKEIKKELESQKAEKIQSIDKLKKEIKPIIKKKITKIKKEKKSLNEETIKKEIKKIIKEKINELPQSEKNKNKNIKDKDNKTYVIATRLTPKLMTNKLKKNQISIKQKIITPASSKKEIRKKIQVPAITMVPLVSKDELKIKTKDKITNAINVSIVFGTKTATELLKKDDKKVVKSPKQTTQTKNIKNEEYVDEKNNKENSNKSLKNNFQSNNISDYSQAKVNIKNVTIKETVTETIPQIENNETKVSQSPRTLENIVLKNSFTDSQTETSPKTIKNEEQTSKKDNLSQETIDKIKNGKEEIKKETTKEKNTIIITSTLFLEKATNNTIENSISEMKSPKEIEDKEYDLYKNEINKLLTEIENYEIKYSTTLTEEQKKVLNKQKEKLRHAKEKIYLQQEIDFEKEKKEFNKAISEEEIKSLQDYLYSLHLEQELEFNNKLIKQVESLEKVSEEQIANIDKKILMKNLEKASLLTEMTSILAFPFIRSRYFFYFTIGLIIDNHFNFINAFFKRKINKFKPADLSALKQGKDALDKAIDQTYNNIEKLQYITYNALNKYPELAYDKKFIKYTTKLNNNLEKNYLKLTKKRNIINKYYSKTNKQIKKLIKKGEKIA